MSSKNIIENNYGSIYKTSGGGKKQFGGKNIKRWLKDILGNRSLDLYLKYAGIKTLTTATLVPMSLILGGEYLASLLKKEQVGGFIPEDLPIIDNALVGNYLKLAGLSVLDITPSTLLPLGVLMVIYDLSRKYIAETAQDGGGRVITGSNIPVSTVQNLDYFFRGLSSPEPLVHTFRKFAEVNNKLQRECGSGNCNANEYTSHNPIVTDKQFVKGFPDVGIKSKYSTNIWSGELIQPAKLDMPKTMAGGSNNKKNKKNEYDTTKFKGKVNKGLKNKNKKVDDISKILQMGLRENQNGAGSDWMSSQYSRGPVNSRTMSETQFRAFNKTSKNIPNTEFASHYSSANLPTPHVPLYRKNITNVNSISTSQYGGDSGLNPTELRGEHPVNYNVATSQFGGKNVWSKIKNPKTGKFVNISSRLGKQIIKNYKNQL
jgi:hypothetical protein